MRLLIDFGIGFVMLGFTEAVIKPLATKFVRRKLIKYSPVVFELLDKKMPQLFGKVSGKELEQIFITELERATGETWSKEDLDQAFSMYDPRITADKTNP